MRMRQGRRLAVWAVVGVVAAGQLASLAPADRGTASGAGGDVAAVGVGAPDLAITSLGYWIPASDGVKKWGTVDGVTGYTFAVFSCNLGTAILPWHGFTAQHPVLVQNLYRLEEGRLTQIGASPAKHVVATIPSGTFCGSCNWPGSFELGVGCSDPYDATRNGEQPRIGPRRDMNAATGVTPYPFTSIDETGDVLFKRMRVANSDLDPALHPDARFFIEGVYLSEADTTFGDPHNNATFREVALGAFTDGGWELLAVGPDDAAPAPALEAWASAHPDVTIATVDIPGDGRFLVGARVTGSGPTWHYEYAVANMTSDRAARGFVVPGANASSVEFEDVESSALEGTSTTDWIADASEVAIAWRTDDEATDPDANALRWGTMYNFAFDAPVPPENGLATIELFRSGLPSNVTVMLPVPSREVCTRDVDGGGDVGFGDVLIVLSNWGTSFPAADVDGDGTVAFADLLMVLSAWGPC